jgi:hypothetical protein
MKIQRLFFVPMLGLPLLSATPMNGTEPSILVRESEAETLSTGLRIYEPYLITGTVLIACNPLFLETETTIAENECFALNQGPEQADIHLAVQRAADRDCILSIYDAGKRPGHPVTCYDTHPLPYVKKRIFIIRRGTGFQCLYPSGKINAQTNVNAHVKRKCGFH